MQQTPLQQVINALVPLAVALVGLLFSMLTAAIRSKVKSEHVRDFLLRLSEQASDVVLELEQTVVAGLREAASDGKLDRNEVEILKERALMQLKWHLGDQGKAEALKVLGFKTEAELENLLRSKIEAEVAKLKPAPEAPKP